MNEGVRVLVVDDERAIRRFLRASLTANGHTVFEAETGQEALNMVVSARPDLIILDLNPPDISGVEVTRRLREWSQTPIIILSVREHDSPEKRVKIKPQRAPRTQRK
jgi:two-component system KDP operon response regulator KdpE